MNDVLIIKPDPVAKHSEIIISPEKNTEKISSFATVISYGSGCKEKWKKGDRIIFNRFFDTPSYVHLNGNKYRMVKEHYVHARIEKCVEHSSQALRDKTDRI